MKYAVEKASVAMIYIQSFIKIDSDILKVDCWGWRGLQTQTQRVRRSLEHTFIFFFFKIRGRDQ
jgi:hypothetical protein